MNNMKLIFLGSGSAFTVGDGNFHSNMLLVDDHHNRLLIDCGSDARFSLYEQGFSHRDINDVYISHLHADHSGGLEWLAFKTKFDTRPPSKPVLHISSNLVDTLWKNVLSGGLQSINDELADLSTFFIVKEIDNTNKFQWHSVDIHLIQTDHILNDKIWVPSYGLFFKINNITCFITTDTQFKPDKYMTCYQQADIIFHDCETTATPSNVHTHYQQLLTLDPAIRAKTWLYHYNPGLLPNAKRDGFRGFVKKGQSFDFYDKSSFT